MWMLLFKCRKIHKVITERKVITEYKLFEGYHNREESGYWYYKEVVKDTLVTIGILLAMKNVVVNTECGRYFHGIDDNTLPRRYICNDHKMWSLYF